jgi:phage baseplate assembly protein V
MFDEILHRLTELERRVANTVRPGKVVKVDPAKGLVKLKVAELETGWLPWMTQAGDINAYIPPAVGQQMLLISPSGEPGQGWAAPGGFSNQFTQPHDQGGQMKITHGSVIIFTDGQKIHVTADHAVIEAGKVDLGGEGGPAVARIGDQTSDGATIVSGSGKVFAA